MRMRLQTRVLIAILLGLFAWGTCVHAQDRRSASAQLHIQVTVIPTLVVAQSARVQSPQPSLSPIMFTLQNNDRNSRTYSVRDYAIDGRPGNSPAVLKTLTAVPE
jgi:hypothetical protein